MPGARAEWAQSAFGGLLDAAPDAMVVVDDQGRIQVGNAQALAMFGYERGELVGEPVERLSPAGLRAQHARHRTDFVAAPRLRAMGRGLDLRACRKDGSEFPVEISLAPLRTEQGLFVSAAIRDITRRKREEQLFRGLLEAAPDAMVIVDREGSIVLVNAQVEKLFGYARGELVGRPVEMLVPERFGAHTSFREGYLGEPRTRPMGLAGNLAARRKDGSEFPVEISLAPLETEDGLLVSAAVRDITERRRTQEAADRAKDEFFATVSHELRTPLTSIIGYAELMEDVAGLPAEARSFLEVIGRSATRELRLVDDLLTLVKMGSDGLSMAVEDVDLVALARDAVSDCAPTAVERRLQVGLVAPERPVVVPGDPVRLGQVLDNLLSNAMKFTPDEGRVEVRVGAEHEWVVAEVCDDGPGIAPEDQARLFERLFRTRAVVEANVPGAGLGLSIARGIAEAHGGSLAVESAPGRGTIFRLTLPAVPGAVVPRQAHGGLPGAPPRYLPGR
ncbi:MAG: PAS domain S-box protein [Marmoricola sp.]